MLIRPKRLFVSGKSQGIQLFRGDEKSEGSVSGSVRWPLEGKQRAKTPKANAQTQKLWFLKSLISDHCATKWEHENHESMPSSTSTYLVRLVRPSLDSLVATSPRPSASASQVRRPSFCRRTREEKKSWLGAKTSSASSRSLDKGRKLSANLWATQKCTEIMKHNHCIHIFQKNVYDVFTMSTTHPGIGWLLSNPQKGAPLKVPQRYCRLPFETITWTNRDQPGPTRHYMSTRSVAITDSYRLSMNQCQSKIKCHVHFQLVHLTSRTSCHPKCQEPADCFPWNFETSIGGEKKLLSPPRPYLVAYGHVRFTLQIVFVVLMQPQQRLRSPSVWFGVQSGSKRSMKPNGP